MAFQCDDPEDYDDENYCICPRCDGYGSISCYCGGDQCYCSNDGEQECPFCLGESEVSQTRFEYFIRREAEHAKERAEVWAALRNSGGGE